MKKNILLIALIAMILPGFVYGQCTVFGVDATLADPAPDPIAITEACDQSAITIAISNCDDALLGGFYNAGPNDGTFDPGNADPVDPVTFPSLAAIPAIDIYASTAAGDYYIGTEYGALLGDDCSVPGTLIHPGGCDVSNQTFYALVVMDIYEFDDVAGALGAYLNSYIGDAAAEPGCGNIAAVGAVDVYPILAATDVTADAGTCGTLTVDLTAADGTICETRTQACVNDGDTFAADFSDTFADPQACSTLTATTAACAGCVAPVACDIGADTGTSVVYCFGDTSPESIGADFNYDDTGFNAGPNANADAAVWFIEICGTYDPALDATPGDPTSNPSYTGFFVSQTDDSYTGVGGPSADGCDPFEGCDFITLIPATTLGIDPVTGSVLTDPDAANQCYGTPLTVGFRPEITAAGGPYDCMAGITLAVTGGAPSDGAACVNPDAGQAVAGEYTIGGDLTGTTAGGAITFTGLADNTTFNYTITDGTGCTGTGTFTTPVCAMCPNYVGTSVSAAEVCDGETVTVCVAFDAAADDVTVNGVGPAAAGDVQICYDVIAANISCDPAPEASTPAVVCTIDGSAITVTDAAWTTNPVLMETIVQSDCAGTAGSATLEAMDGTVCASETIGQAGAANVCPDINDTDADLAYDFTAFSTACFTGTSQVSAPIDCAVTCAACPAVTGVTASAADVCDGAVVTVCVTFDAAADDVTVNGAGPATAGDTQICYDVTAANTGCNALPETSTPMVMCTLDNMPLPGVTDATWNTHPSLTEAITQPDCAGTAGSAVLTAADGTECDRVDGTTGVPNVCPDTNDTDASLTYDFTIYNDVAGCFVGTSGSFTTDCAVECANPVDIAIADPCNCNLGVEIDGDLDNGNELAQETITFSGGSGTYVVTVVSGLVDITNTAVTVVSANADIGAGSSFVAYVPTDGATTYTITIADANDPANTATISGGPCNACPVAPDQVPTVGEWGLIILGLLMSITAIVGIRQRREEEATA